MKDFEWLIYLSLLNYFITNKNNKIAFGGQPYDYLKTYKMHNGITFEPIIYYVDDINEINNVFTMLIKKVSEKADEFRNTEYTYEAARGYKIKINGEMITVFSIEQTDEGKIIKYVPKCPNFIMKDVELPRRKSFSMSIRGKNTILKSLSFDDVNDVRDDYLYYNRNDRPQKYYLTLSSQISDKICENKPQLNDINGSIKKYTDPFTYAEINKYFMYGTGNAKSICDDIIKSHRQLGDTYYNSFADSFYLYRIQWGLLAKGDGKIIGLHNITAGTILSFKGFVSTSYSSNFAYSQFIREGVIIIRFLIRNTDKNFIFIDDYSTTPQEHEVLLMNGQKFKVIGDIKYKNIQHTSNHFTSTCDNINFISVPRITLTLCTDDVISGGGTVYEVDTVFDCEYQKETKITPPKLTRPTQPIMNYPKYEFPVENSLLASPAAYRKKYRSYKKKYLDLKNKYRDDV